MHKNVNNETNETPQNNRSKWSDFFKSSKTYLHLKDGTKFMGYSDRNVEPNATGEVVFNTGMTGYVESLTDPSYKNQILVFTYPLIGNYGVDIKSYESEKIQVSGVVVAETATNWSHPSSSLSFAEWLQSQNIPLLFGADTRAITKHIRQSGSMFGTLGDVNFADLNPNSDKPLSIQPETITHNKQYTKKVIVVDCGAKQNIIKSLLTLPIQVQVVPNDYDYTAEQYDGVLLSNGPGDPTQYADTIVITKKAIKLNKPIFGICLGNQILGLAAGAKTYKLKFGHRGHNQPCQDTRTKKAYITSQNHGYAIDEESLPIGWRVSYTNLNDGSIEGIEHKTKPYFAVQFHPEACPGPTDTQWLFERFYKSL